jgi:GDP-mannose 6-dehydrogenase
MTHNIEDVVDHAQTVVVGTKDPDFENIGERMRDDQVLVDFVRIPNQGRELGKYDGICW